MLRYCDVILSLHMYVLINGMGLQEENEEEESDAMVNQIMTELGIDLANQFAAPQAALAVGAPQRVAVAEGGVPAGGAGPAAVGGPGGVDADLLARLNNLRGGGAAPGGGAP